MLTYGLVIESPHLKYKVNYLMMYSINQVKMREVSKEQHAYLMIVLNYKETLFTHYC